MLRAVRFAARFSFSIDPETGEAIRQLAPELVGISRERIGDEVKKMLSDPNRGVAAWELQYLGLDRVIFADSRRDPSLNISFPEFFGRVWTVVTCPIKFR